MNKFNPVFGVISFFPDDPELRKLRVDRLNTLIKQIDFIFNVPIMIIAQHWSGISLREGTTRKPIIIYNYKEGLGINNARKTLRQKFLESEYNYLIMIDDDGVIAGTPEGGRRYLAKMAEHPYGFCEFKPSLLKLFAISKNCYELINIPDGGADDPDPQMRQFEDMFVCRSLKRVYPEREFFFKMSKDLIELSDAAHDKGNTGWHRVYDEDFKERKWDRHDTGGNTRYMVAQATKETILHPELIKRRDLNDESLLDWNDIYSVEKFDKGLLKL